MNNDMQVSLISHFIESDFINLLYIACKTCTSEDLPSTNGVHIDTKKKLIYSVYKSGHTSVLEHVSFTFAISGVSRALSHQLVRHRIGVSFSQQSQRYVDMSNAKFVIPNHDEKMNLEIGRIQALYDYLISTGMKEEDARYILPNACCTNLIMTVNLSELIHICNLRLCSCAQWEIRNLFLEIKSIISVYSEFFGNMLHPKCFDTGKCNEMRSNGCKIYERYAKLNETK